MKKHILSGVIHFSLLITTWFICSGHLSYFFITVGTLSAVGVTLKTRIMGLSDADSYSRCKPLALLQYLPWLVLEILKSALSIVAIIWSPRSTVEPHFVELPCNQSLPALLSNSITLTPGTLSAKLSEDGKSLKVHALTKKSASGLEDLRLRVARLNR